ncbi:hypothetical protein Glove_575g31 [Diversispora epigaea]|uniref:CR-type domain-containing protein n=1 Tax=Diversispora epigaea TaxID=1348612 RepID=A0A397GE06_9GLOM|nr:hypothetical protein Glove_575g31 [Diversispora epigaea]
MANCKRCAGSGKMKCGSCDGSGYVIRTEIKNPMGLTIYDICEVKITCPGPCKGEGKVTCSKCGGNGYE